MTQHSQNVIDFKKWHKQRQDQGISPLAKYAHDRCVAAFERSDWSAFGYWFTIYGRERRHARNLVKRA